MAHRPVGARDDGHVIPDRTAAHVAARVRAAPPRCGNVRVVCVDGPAGSGKTTLADAVAQRLERAPVVHMDDLYDGWAQDLGAPLGIRIGAWLLDAWAAGLPGQHLRYDWGQGRYAGWATVPAAPVVILEGCGSATAAVRRRASLVVWVEAPAEDRLVRGLARDGQALAGHWRAWQAHEDAHFAADGTRAAADVVVDGRTGLVLPG
jgi:hypothetical protein